MRRPPAPADRLGLVRALAALDIDGMLATKQTDRATDIPDRKRLQRLKAEIEGRPRKPRPG